MKHVPIIAPLLLDGYKLGHVRQYPPGTLGVYSNFTPRAPQDPSVCGDFYGEAITLERQRDILAALAALGYSSDNIVMGIGSFSYQHSTRDVHGFAMKATAVRRSDGYHAIYKDPVTGRAKRSARGLLQVTRSPEGALTVRDNATPDERSTGELRTVFCDGVIKSHQSLDSIRATARVERTRILNAGL